ncbi:hypothetical protein C8Q77DRAFT_756550 [Trametes polyzona]|nr:hypothetical protein C8Q77DRAFT_756550 [Trametes polyzona]
MPLPTTSQSRRLGAFAALSSFEPPTSWLVPSRYSQSPTPPGKRLSLPRSSYRAAVQKLSHDRLSATSDPRNALTDYSSCLPWSGETSTLDENRTLVRLT